jgi:hypothetical protein
MQPALKLTEQERLFFMQALNAVAYRENDPGDVWLALLRRFGGLLGIFSRADYQFQSGAPGIAEKVNQINNPRARLYFLRIIHDVHSRDVIYRSFLLKASEDAFVAKFRALYDPLVNAIRLE